MIPPIPISSPRRRAFTLVELLVVIMILGIITSIASLALWDAMQEARAARTRAQIQKIHELIMVRWESYRTRPVPVKTTKLPPEFAAKARLNALRQLMRMELPDRVSDVNDGAMPVLELPDGTDVLLMSAPSLWTGYVRRASMVTTWTSEHQQAECLYMIVASMQDGTRNGLDFFRDNELGDKDGDGMPEIWDAWGNPIRFLRWAPGFPSPIQAVDVQPDPFDPLKLDPRWKNNNANDRHFPSDQSPTYPDPASGSYDATLDDPVQLFPLVFSAGPDGLYNVVLDNYDPGSVSGGELAQDNYDPSDGSYNGVVTTDQLRYAVTDAAPYSNYTPPISTYPTPVWPTKDIDTSAVNVFPLWQTSPRNDPYVILGPGATTPANGGVGVRVGTPYGAGAEDNIDNHFLVVR
jgi:prepilin-type N-terminal cleavage/methylation domain-containing protein